MFCDQPQETIECLMVQCPYSRVMWLPLLGFSLAACWPHLLIATIETGGARFRSGFYTEKGEEIQTLMAAGVRNLWLERSMRILEAKPTMAQQVATLS